MKSAIISLSTLSLILSSCCTMTSQRTEVVTVNSTPAGADITINGYSCGATPQAFEMDARCSHTIILEKENYQPCYYQLDSKTSGGKLCRNASLPIIGCGAGALIGLAVAGGTTGGLALLAPLTIGACGLVAGTATGALGLGVDIYKGSARQLNTKTVDINLQPIE
jgi:hypothetical protein